MLQINNKQWTQDFVDGLSVPCLREERVKLSLTGIATSGAFFYNHKDGNNNVAAQTEGETFDTCMGHADPMCRKVAY